ncbi:hypothetical protein ACLOJK_035902 [Asimina triloba]
MTSLHLSFSHVQALHCNSILDLVSGDRQTHMHGMKKKEEEQEIEIEILKAVAQAWHGRSGSPRPMKDYETQPTHAQSRIKPCSRFKLEAIKELSQSGSESSRRSTWDFSQSLWDSYEIVTLSKKLEDGMVLDHPMDGPGPVLRRRTRESKNSLRNMFHRISSSRRYGGVKIPELDADGNDDGQVSRH